MLVAAAAELVAAAADHAALTTTVTRRDLRPVPGVALKLAGAENLPGITDDGRRVAFLDLPLTGVVTIPPSRSGFRFEPPHVTIPDLAHPPATAAFAGLPTATDLALSIVTPMPAPPIPNWPSAFLSHVYK